MAVPTVPTVPVVRERDRDRIAELQANPEMFAILVRHAYRGVRVQFLLRAVVLAFMVAVISWVPPAHDRTASVLVVVAYLLWTVALVGWTSRGGVGPVRWMWVALLVDAGAIGTLTLVAGINSAQNWTADVLVNGLFLIPVLAATQLRPIVCAAVAIPTTVVYFLTSVFTMDANSEPWSSVLLRTWVMAGLAAGCIALSRVQLSRVATIAGLARDRSGLLADLTNAESSTRARLAEDLHDGALQYVLAARQDLEDVRAVADPATYARLEHALAQTSSLLRATVSDLHPAVLAAAGLAQAVQDLGAREAERTGLAVTVQAQRWPAGTGPLDQLLFTTVRELLVNVVKHAGATSVRIELTQDGARARLVVADDGRGVDASALVKRVAEGHIGLASLRARVAGADGRVEIGPNTPTGTVVTVELPVPR
jgi:two-component system NarL family sensor kinase